MRPVNAMITLAGLAGVFALAILLATPGCSTQKVSDARAIAAFEASKLGTAQGSQPSAMRRSIHDPFREKACDECHESKMSEKLKEPPPKLCYNCHDDWSKNQDVVHQPVAEGECLSCHRPHFSARDSLLIKGRKVICGDCHDPFTKRVIHEPVENGACLDCHAVHSSKIKGRLKRPANELCAVCHKPADMAAVAKHRVPEVQNCIACHEVHDSNLAHLMKTAAKPAK